MPSSSLVGPQYNFHGDDALHDKTPSVQGLVASLPATVPALWQYLTRGGGEEGKRAAIAKLPMNNFFSQWFMKTGVERLWGIMLHPPLSYLGDSFQYRSADGGNNSILHPDLGKAGVPYAKSVPSKTGIHGARPDPGDLFDLLMARKDDKESSSGLSSMLLYHADIIIHDIFRTNTYDKNISDTSSYLDLSPLYGCDKANQDTIRQKELGLLKPDSFAEKRLLLQPPGVCMYLIMYSRFHNYVAKQLLEINENGKFSLPCLEDSEQWKGLNSEQRQAMKDKQDEDLFQTARLITCGLYINISIHDYLRALMGFHQKNTPWTLDPRIKIPHGDDKTGIQRGIGNQVSVEFNLLYRFHSALSTRDRVWSEGFFIDTVMHRVKSKDGIIDEQTGKRFEITEEQIRSGEIPVPVFNKITGAEKNKGKSRKDIDTELAKELDRDNKAAFVPSGLEIIGFDKDTSAPTYKFRRDASGKFDDAELVAEMIQVIEDPICQFGGQNVPKIFKAIEILGILQARKWEVATLNEFREFFGLKRHEHFEDINEDKGITNALRDLYDDPDMVELYPGLFCEGKGRCLDPGTSGPNNGSTALWGGIFGDAITLVRSDRFYTVDWNVGSLTSWGMHEVTADPQVLNGSVFHRLFQRAFPGYLNFNSIHLWQPFFTPGKNIELAKQQGVISSVDISDIENGSIQSKGKAQRKIIKGSSKTVPDKVPKPTPVLKTSNYRDIRDKILGEYKAEFQNPGLLDKHIITGEYLQAMMTGTSSGFDRAAGSFQELFNPEIRTMFLDYFVKMSKEITEREKRSLQKLTISFEQEKKKLGDLRLSKGILEQEEKKLVDLERKFKGRAVPAREQVYQIDIVRDYAIPVITRFFVDFLGFWDCVKTPRHQNRQYNENQIYEHIRNCQDYRSYQSDETTMWKRRLAFKESITFLRERAEYGARRARGFFGLVPRDNRTTGDRAYVVELRNFGVQVSKALAKKLQNTDEVAAMMLVIALEAAHKSVMTFTEVLAYFIDHPHEKEPDVSNWINIQNLAYENTPEANETLKRYVLEAQRIRVDFPLVRTYSPTKPEKEFKLRLTNDTTEEVTLRKGERVILQLRAAQQCEKIFPDPKNGKSVDPNDAEIIFPNPSTLSLNPDDRKLKNYLIYGQDSHFTLGIKQLTLLGLTGMIKYIALTKELRVAHDKLGRLKRAKTPEGVENYLTVQWNQLVQFPTTWSLRFNGEGRGVFVDGDNADQGHGINQVYQKPTPSPSTDPSNTTYESPAVSTAKSPLASQNGAVKQQGTSYY